MSVDFPTPGCPFIQSKPCRFLDHSKYFGSPESQVHVLDAASAMSFLRSLISENARDCRQALVACSSAFSRSCSFVVSLVGS